MTDETAMMRIVSGAIRDTINQHGPITKIWIGSASKRIVKQIMGNVSAIIKKDKKDPKQKIATRRPKTKPIQRIKDDPIQSGSPVLIKRNPHADYDTNTIGRVLFIRTNKFSGNKLHYVRYCSCTNRQEITKPFSLSDISLFKQTNE